MINNLKINNSIKGNGFEFSCKLIQFKISDYNVHVSAKNRKKGYSLRLAVSSRGLGQ